MSGRLRGRTAFVTGATGGIGSAICRELAAEGARVALGWRSDEAAARQLLEELPGEGHGVLRAVVDDSASLAEAAAGLAERFGRLDLLVNNAGFTRFVDHGDLAALDDELFDAIMRVNVRGPFAVLRACKALLDRSDRALVVNISSIAARTGQGSNVAYCASKAALDSLTRSLGRALAPGIRVVSIAPGLVEGRYSDSFDETWKQRQRDSTPLKRLARAEDVARAVLSVAAELTFTTGAVIPVDGGRPLS